MNLSRLTILASACFAFVATVASAQSAPPVADTYSFNAEPAQNFGAQPILVVQPGANSYIRFNLSSVPAGVTVNKATLRLYLDAITGNGSFDVYQLGNSWGESTLSYSNAPSMGASATGGHPIALTTSADNQFVLIDITSLVQGWTRRQHRQQRTPRCQLPAGARVSAFGQQGKHFYHSHQPELGNCPLNGSSRCKWRNRLDRPAGPTDQQAGRCQGRNRLDFGPAGPIGPAGPAGAKCAQPAQPDRRGPIGPAGPAGRKAARQGQTEPLAQPGPIGPAGAAGAAGAKGATGSTGRPTGSQGAGRTTRHARITGTSRAFRTRRASRPSRSPGFNFYRPVQHRGQPTARTTLSPMQRLNLRGARQLSLRAPTTPNLEPGLGIDGAGQALPGATGSTQARQARKEPPGQPGTPGSQGPPGPPGPNGSSWTDRTGRHRRSHQHARTDLPVLLPR